MSKHRSRELDDAVHTIRDLTIRDVVQVYPGSGKHPFREVKTPVMEITLGRARKVLLAAEMSSQPDGYSATTPLNGSPGAGKGGGMRMGIVDPQTGEKDWVPTSSTETAAIDTAPQPDPVARRARSVNRLLLTLAATLSALDRTLDRFDQLQSTAAVPDPPMCWLAQVRYQLPFDDEWDVRERGRTTTFAGQLDAPFDEPRRVSMFVYRFVHNHGRLPERDEMLRQVERAVVKSHVRVR